MKESGPQTFLHGFGKADSRGNAFWLHTYNRDLLRAFAQKGSRGQQLSCITFVGGCGAGDGALRNRAISERVYSTRAGTPINGVQYQNGRTSGDLFEEHQPLRAPVHKSHLISPQDGVLRHLSQEFQAKPVIAE